MNQHFVAESKIVHVQFIGVVDVDFAVDVDCAVGATGDVGCAVDEVLWTFHEQLSILSYFNKVVF